eukprot:GFKZ01004891.1.p1 GENE.GFKZ01004891.1~~GFKZ01004891.1.p1  ORF type:complete len:123 (-),score=26.78 GFKZ01004891.1:496-864(-)
MSLLDATLKLEQLVYAIESKQRLAESLETRHVLYQRAVQHLTTVKGSCLLNMGYPCTLAKLPAPAAAQLVENEERRVWNEVQNVRLELHRLEMKAEDMRELVKEKQQMQEEEEDGTDAETAK